LIMDFEADDPFYTETMARLLAKQGRYDGAATIYRHLLAKAPDRTDLAVALQSVVAQMDDGAVAWSAVSGLVQRWITLMLRQNALQRLERLPIHRLRADRRVEGKRFHSDEEKHVN
jgi:hypothetical protein